MFRFIDMCFLCLERNKNMLSILLQDEDGIAIQEKMKYILTELVHFKPELPKNICTDCLKCLNNVFKFRQKCIHNLICLQLYIDHISTEDKANYFSTSTGGIFTQQAYNTSNNTQNETNQNSTHQIQANELNKEVVVKTEQKDISSDLEDGSLSSDGIHTGNFNEVFIKQEVENANDHRTNFEAPIITDTTGNSCLERNIDAEDKTTEAKLEDNEIGTKDDPLMLENINIDMPEYAEDADDNSQPTTAATPDDKIYKCDECPKAYSHKKGLQRHKRSHSGIKPFVCDICHKAFVRRCALNDHKRTHTGEKPYKCDTCDKSFFSQSNLIQHKHTHTGAKPFKCDICHKAFNTPYYLTTHKLIHNDVKHHKCNVCHKAFINDATLKKHVKIHNGEKPFKCDLCNSFYMSSYHLNRHKRTHSDERPFKCEICGVTYRTVSSIKEHMLKHSGEKPFECNLCPYKTTNKINLKSHTQQKH